jgi:Flp pilus assembly protein TadB
MVSIISLLADQRSKFVEQFLPDVLLLMSSNLRSGITPEEAFILSARPEFGFLADKIKDAGKRLATGATIQEAFTHLKSKISSKLFSQTIGLIIEGLDSGGEIATLLESTANDIKDMESIRKEVNSMIFIYALFIFIAACMIAPILYAVSIQLANILSKLSQSIAVQFVTEQSQTLKLMPTGISEKFLNNFAYVNLIVTTAFSSLIVALINRGDEKYGLRYIPFFVGLALILFFVARYALNLFFGGIKAI